MGGEVGEVEKDGVFGFVKVVWVVGFLWRWEVIIK